MAAPERKASSPACKIVIYMNWMGVKAYGK